MHRFLAVSTLVLVSLASAGCMGVSTDYSKVDIAQVSGTITLDAQPLSGVTVLFEAPDKTTAFGTTDASGQFTIATPAGSGLVASGLAYAEPANANREDNIWVFDIRAEKTLQLGDRVRARIALDAFNLTNSHASETIGRATGLAYQKPTAILVPASAPRPLDSCDNGSARPPKLNAGGSSLTTNIGTSSTLIHLVRPTSSSSPSFPLISQLSGSRRTDHGGISKPLSGFSGGAGGGPYPGS